MTSREFCYWLQGFFEVSKKGWVEGLDKEQTATIQKHLQLVFKHEIDGSYPNREELDAIHKGIPHTKPLTLADVYALMEEEHPKLKKELEEMLKKHAAMPHSMRPGSDPHIRC